MSRHNEKITRLYVGELPLIKNVIERLGLKEIFAKYIKTHKKEKIPAVDSLMMLLFNITCGRQPLYPEHRIAYHPTTAKIFDRFSGISLYYLKKGRNIKRYQDQLSDLQKEIISILGMSEKDYWL